MVKRALESELKAAAQEYPVVTVLGPRQAGKTTLCRMAFPSLPYISLEDPDIRLWAQDDPRGFLKTNPGPIILDEIQRVPDLLSYIQGIVDRNGINGEYILTGSHQLELHHSISQSLAGRTAVLNLFPFSISELGEYQSINDPYNWIFRGFFPRLHENKMNPVRYYRSYLQTYVERDVRAMINLKDQNAFHIFLRLLAGRIGQLINYNSLANDVGVSSTTIKQWISILKASYLILELPPYFANIRKRLVKASKIYFIDVGLASYLLDLHDPSSVERDSLRGNLFENLVILDIWKNILNRGESPQCFFYRDSHGNEVDLLIKKGRSITAVEIKSAVTFSSDFLKGLLNFQSLKINESMREMVIFGGDEVIQFRGIDIIPITSA